MDILELVKANKGFINPPNAVVERLKLAIDSTKTMLEDENRILIDLNNPRIVSFIVDHAVWLYDSKGEKGPMPQHLRFRLNNLYIHNRKGDTNV